MKRFTLARSIVTTALVAAAFAPAAQAAGHYSNIYVFGDSLSDTGAFGGVGGAPAGARAGYYTNGTWSTFYDELLAAKYGLKLTPANAANPSLAAGGNNYAQGGARANPGSGRDDIAAQVSKFLTASGGKADPNALYTLWIGGNDVMPAITAGLTSGANAAQAVMSQAATTAVQQVGALQAAGAKRIVVLNGPDVGRTPLLFSSVVSTVSATAAPQIGAAVGTTATATQILGGINPALVNPANPAAATLIAATANALKTATPAAADVSAATRKALNAGGTDANAAIAAAAGASATAIVGGYASAAAKAVANTLVGAGVIANPSSSAAALAQYNAIVSGVTTNLNAAVASQATSIGAAISTNYATLSATATSLMDNVFNSTLNAGIGSINKGGIVQIDINKLMKEVIANPAAFGFANITGSACDTFGGAPCSTADAARFDSSKQFFFGDPFHPTPETHKAVYAVIASTLDAPYMAAQLVQGQAVAADAAQLALDARSTKARSVGAISTIAQVSSLSNDQDGNVDALQSDGKNAAVTVGLDYQVFKDFSVGAAFTHATNETEFAGGLGGFDSTNQVLSVFSRMDHGAISVSTDAYFGSTRFDEVDRHVQLNALKRTERGDTSGTIAGLRLSGSYLISLGKINVSPTLSVAFRENKVGGFVESCSDTSYANFCSTSMRYGKQRVTSLLGGAGVKFDADMGMFQPFGSAMYYSESKDKDRQVEAAQVTASSNFKTDVFTPDTSFGVLNVGSRFQITKTLGAYAVYNRVFGASDDKRDSISLGLQAAF